MYVGFHVVSGNAAPSIAPVTPDPLPTEAASGLQVEPFVSICVSCICCMYTGRCYASAHKNISVCTYVQQAHNRMRVDTISAHPPDTIWDAVQLMEDTLDEESRRLFTSVLIHECVHDHLITYMYVRTHMCVQACICSCTQVCM